MGYAARGWRRARQREGRRRGAPCGADKVGDTVELVLIEVADGAVAQELARHAQSGLRVHGITTNVG